MYKKYILSIGIVVITIIGVVGFVQPPVTEAFSLWGPWQLSQPYLLLSSYEGEPGTQVTVTGHGFQQYENVTVTLFAKSVQVIANANGSITNVPIVVPYVSDGNYKVIATGLLSGKTATANFYISGYYPNINPSTYYIGKGKNLSVSGTNFAPNQEVLIYVNGVNVGTTNSNGSGNVSFSIVTPTTGSNFTLKAQTVLGLASSRTITLIR